jgi:hypothetical protein
MSPHFTPFRFAVSALICVASLGVAPGARAYTTEGVSWVGATTTVYYILPNGSTAESTAVLDGMQEWNDATAFKYVAVAGSADPCDSTKPNGVAFGATSCGDSFGSTTLAVTTYEYDPSTNLLTHAGIVFNDNTTFSVYDGPLQSFATDFKRVATHELGHMLGMNHENDPDIPAIMAPTVSNVDRPTADDIAGVQSIYGPVSAAQTSLVSAVLPASRSVLVNATATAFATIVNAGAQVANGCTLALASPISAAFSYQTTSAATNQPTGSPNQPAAIAVGGSQSFIFSITPTAFLNPTDVGLTMQCANAPAAPSTVGLNTLLLSASTTPTLDIVALAATAQNDGYVHIGAGQGAGAFALATVNLGASGTVTASADTGTTKLPLTVTLCQTNPATGQCLSPAGPTAQLVIDTNDTPTFSIFVNSTASISPDPANSRIFVRFRDSGGATRGSTSVAVTSF